MLKWYYYVLFVVITLIALSMTWWSLFDLGVNTLSVPVLLAAGASLLFDLGGIYLVLLSIKYATTDDSGFWTEMGAFAFLATSTWIVYQHGVLAGYPIAGVLMFAAAPIVLGIVLKATLQYLTRQQRRSAGRVTDRLPSVGWLTWVRYRSQTWRLMSVAMQGRLVRAADKLEMSEDRHNIFGRGQDTLKVSASVPETATDKTDNNVQTQTSIEDKKPQQLSEAVSKPQLTSADKPVLPVWLPHEPLMSLGTLVRTCMDNGVLDIETIYRYAVLIKGQDVNKASLARTMTREKQKIS